MRRPRDAGQTLVALLIFMLLAIAITTAAAAITVINTQGGNNYAGGEATLQAAESGAENALLRLQRDPSYSGETLHINSTLTATITVSGSSTLTITSKGTATSGLVRTIVVTATNSNNVITVTGWSETP